MCVYLVIQSCPPLCNFIELTYQASLLIGFSRQEYWCGLPFPTPGDLPDPEIKPESLPTLAGDFLTMSATWEASLIMLHVKDGGKEESSAVNQKIGGSSPPGPTAPVTSLRCS